jgi:hypothetical protein
MDLVLWVTLAATASVLLFSITTHLSQNIAPIPFLWVLPLALYLATFMIAFESDKLYNRAVMFFLMVPVFYYMARDLYEDAGNLHIKYLIPIFSAGLFLGCMLCHGELARRRPAPRYLTLFYLMVSLGGALGGTFVALIAPRIFSSNFELPIAIGACAIIGAVVMSETVFPRPRRWVTILFMVLSLLGVAAALIFPLGERHFKQALAAGACSIVGAAIVFFGTQNKIALWTFRVALLLAVGFYLGYLGQQEKEKEKGYRLAARNFYGVLHIKDDLSTSEDEYSQRTLYHGTRQRLTTVNIRASVARFARFRSAARCVSASSALARGCSPITAARAISTASSKLIPWCKISPRRNLPSILTRLPINVS